MLVIEVDTSISNGSPDVGNPAAIGFGVMKGFSPPCGTTAFTVGSELSMIATIPLSVARFRYDARQAIWCERRMTTVPVPHAAGHCHGALECAQREPRSGQSFAVPILRGGAAIEHFGFA